MRNLREVSRRRARIPAVVHILDDVTVGVVIRRDSLAAAVDESSWCSSGSSVGLRSLRRR
jgi:hypothetical protein